MPCYSTIRNCINLMDNTIHATKRGGEFLVRPSRHRSPVDFHIKVYRRAKRERDLRSLFVVLADNVRALYSRLRTETHKFN